MGLVMGLVLGQIRYRGSTIGGAMTLSIALSGLLVTTMFWLGPETRGRHVSAVQNHEGWRTSRPAGLRLRKGVTDKGPAARRGRARRFGLRRQFF
jgi:hypothetical protein